MSITSASLPLGATFAPTGGVATVFTPSALPVVSGVQVVAATDTDAVTRRNITVKARNATLNGSTGKFSGKDKRSSVFCIPEVLPDGTISFDLIRVEMEVHPQSPATKVAALLSGGACMISDADFTNLWTLGSAV